MKVRDFDFYRAFLRRHSGLYLNSTQAYLLSSKLTPVSKKWGFEKFDDMIIELKSFPREDLIFDIIEAMSDPQTSFFSPAPLFQALQNDLIPAYLRQHKSQKKLNIRCLGCSTGQEAYSLNMILLENKMRGCKVKIYASDISNSAIEKASKGIYTQSEVQDGLPTHLLMTYFEQHENLWFAKPALKKDITFYYSNLMDKITPPEQYDIIFCRNIFENFDYNAKADILDHLATFISSDGYIIFGSDENISDYSDKYSAIGTVPDVYQLSLDK